MKKIFCLIIILYLPFISYNLIAQSKDETSAKKNIIVLKGQAKKDKILLRWAVSSPEAWLILNKYGYKITREIILRDGKLLSNTTTQTIKDVIKPLPLEQWRSIVEKSDEAAVVAQALYGEDFEVTGQSGLANIIATNRQNEQRFTFSMIMVAKNFEVAQMAGLGFTDTDVKPNEKYFYKIYSLAPKDDISIQPTSIFIGHSDQEPLPPPFDVSAVFNDRAVLLRWNIKMLEDYYTEYFVEKSSDSINFKRLTENTYSDYTNPDFIQRPDIMSFMDSIQNDTKYYYRVVGISHFGEKGPPSEILSGMGRDKFNQAPKITKVKIINEKTAVINWYIDTTFNKQIKKFSIERSDKVNSNFVIVNDSLPPNQREFTYTNLLSTNYFRIKLFTLEDKVILSTPKLVQPIDSIPPKKPSKLDYQIQDDKWVQITWLPNTEPDIKGYKVYRGYKPNEEFSLLTKYDLDSPIFKDEFDINSLNGKIYYIVIASDKKGNLSKPSDTLKVILPDKIPPSTPFINNLSYKNDIITLQWSLGNDDDLQKIMIYRKENDMPQWELQKIITNLSQKKYLDNNIKKGNHYRYTITVFDESNNESKPSKPNRIDIPKISVKPQIKGLNYAIDRKANQISIYWDEYEEKNVTSINFYKALKGKKLSLYTKLGKEDFKVVDKSVIPGKTYIYSLQAVFDDGSVSKSSEIEIVFR